MSVETDTHVLLTLGRPLRVIVCPLCGALVVDGELEKHALAHELATRRK